MTSTGDLASSRVHVLQLGCFAAAAALVGYGVATAIEASRNEKRRARGADGSEGGGADAGSAAGSPGDPRQPSMESYAESEWQKMPTREAVRKRQAQEGDVCQEEVRHPVDRGPVHMSSTDTIALVMVGLPGRGKTSVAHRTARYLSFFHGLEAKVFNVGNRRRNAAGYMKEGDYNFDDERWMQQRLRYNYETLQEMIGFLQSGSPSRVGIFDASNVTRERRRWILNHLQVLGQIQVIFVELINAKTMVRSEEMAESDKRSGPAHPEVDFSKRVTQYAKNYEPMASGGPEDPEHQLAYIKCIENGSHIILNEIKGYMPGRITQFISNCCRHPYLMGKRLYLSRHGQSQYNAAGRIGGDSDLTDMGQRYALALARFAESDICRDPRGNQQPARLWTSTLRRTRQTARHIRSPVILRNGEAWIQMKPRVWSNLDEIYAGACDGLTYEQIKQKYAREAEARKKDKLGYRYPRGESYLDVIQRLEPLIQEVERHDEPLLIVGHQGVLRMLLAFYKGIPREKAPHETIPLNHVVELLPHAYSCKEVIHNLLPEDVARDDGQKHH